MIQRRIATVRKPQDENGFLGAGHIARAVIRNNFAESDPFILLMDDMLDKKDNEPVGGPHPHAGFETVTLVLEGEIGDGEHRMKAGDFQLMTAGSGVIHTETINKIDKMRILQLWINLPQKDRWAEPRQQDLPLEHVPQLSANGVHIKLYSGELAGLKSPVLNHTPFILADITLQPGTTTNVQLPANYNTMLYGIEGSLTIGREQQLSADHAAWLIRHNDEDGMSELHLSASSSIARLVLYAAWPLGEGIVAHGPFIADTPEDIVRLYREYREGNMPHISNIAGEQLMVL